MRAQGPEAWRCTGPGYAVGLIGRTRWTQGWEERRTGEDLVGLRSGGSVLD